jgi:formyl transferase-like protein
MLRIVLYTRDGFRHDPLFLYLHAHIAARWPDTHVVAVRGRSAPAQAALRKWRKMRRVGWRRTVAFLSSLPLSLFFRARYEREIAEGLNALPRPLVAIDESRLHRTGSVNGPGAVAMLQAIQPDVMIQAGAGIIEPRIFGIARLGMLNMHHGIAPLIRGVDSILWALWESKPGWIGSTIHRVDQGIDTGDVLAYSRIERQSQEGFPSLFVRATEAGTAQSLAAIERLERGESWKLEPPSEESAYRSTISGWQMLRIEMRR